MNSNKTGPILIGTILVMILCLLVLCCLVIASIIYFGATKADELSTDLPDFLEPTPIVTLDPNQSNLLPEVIAQTQLTLDTLNESVVPINDPIDLAGRLGGKPGVPSQLIDPNAPYELGAKKEFWVTNTDTNENFKVNMTLQFVGDNLYFWIQDGVKYKDSDLQKLATTFDQEIVPTNREFFGSEWNPGVDGDPRFHVLYAGGLGEYLAGYFSSADELHPDAHPYSNAHEMFLLNSDTVRLYESYTYGTLAHEFQHMIHWYQDKNEETWVNEGFSMLAEHINDLDSGGFDWDYMRNPDLQLNNWGGETGENGPNYGASFLFMVYFLDRFGEDATKALVSHDANGFAGIDEVMKELNIINPDTGKPYTGIEVFADWTVANWLQKSGLDKKRYDYLSYTPFDMNATETHYSCPVTITSDVYQFGVDYIEFACKGSYPLNFQGSDAVKLLPFQNPPSGDYFFWSNQGDESNMRLKQEFDLTGVTGQVELAFKTWYDLETDCDYVYISASTDGVNWEILNSERCTSENPSGNSYGCGWNGQTHTWVGESVDLSKFAGQRVTLQFDYVTDAAVNGRGMALDDFAIPAIGYQSNLETDDGGWIAEGFVRVQNLLPQSFTVSIIRNGNPKTVEHYFVEAGEKLQLTIDINDPRHESVVLLVSGTTLFTTEKATYKIDIN